MASPPPPPPKSGAISSTLPGHHDYDRPAPPLPTATPTTYSSPLSPSDRSFTQHAHAPSTSGQSFAPAPTPQVAPEEQWTPAVLNDKSKPDLEAILRDPALLTSLLSAPSTTHPALQSSQQPLQSQLEANIALARHVLAVEGQIRSVRSSLTPSLLRVAALERQFRAKQEEMDVALSPWAPKAVHTRLGQGIQEQEAWCGAMEESFLDGEGDGRAGDREVAEWLRKYREGRKVLELRREKKSRLEEGRVGGWR